MKNGHCPKCASQEVYYSDAQGVQHGFTDAARMRIFKDKKWVPDIAVLEMAYYVCQSCGYCETYVLKLAELAKLTDCTNWRKVGASTQQP